MYWPLRLIACPIFLSERFGATPSKHSTAGSWLLLDHLPNLGIEPPNRDSSVLARRQRGAEIALAGRDSYHVLGTVGFLLLTNASYTASRPVKAPANRVGDGSVGTGNSISYFIIESVG